ncbi:MAG: hypothetical protein K2W78_10385 [Xanthobacteraceae bacterium]|nr:hypothetical protein [Xanthobacteraceae bacterium]
MTKTANDKRPTHIVWQVMGEGDKARWTRIGAGWANHDGKGITLSFDAIPMNGRTVVRAFAETENAQEGGAQ